MTLAQNLNSVQELIRKAAERTNRDVNDIKLVAVSKTHPAQLLQTAIDAGVRVLGENKVQEAEKKIEALGRNAAEWHLIGHLQSNKARKAVQLFDVIHSIDSMQLAERLERICDEERRDSLSVLIHVNLGGEATKSGISERELHNLSNYLVKCKHLRLNGLMLVPPFFKDAESVRPYFIKLRQIRDKMLTAGHFANNKGELSMGMSHDFIVAIEEGATIVRVGTAIFGQRL